MYLGDVLDSLSMRRDANELWTAAAALTKSSMMDLGLKEMLRVPEDESATLKGASLHAEALLRLSTVLTVRDGGCMCGAR